MKKRNAYYRLLDIFRAVLCIAVLLYHVKLLKGGFLAVCGFFVLSGFLTTRSLLNKTEEKNKFYSIDDDFQKKSYSVLDVLKQYYVSRFKKLYLPLICVTFITLAVFSFIKDAVWVSLKPETTSVLLGYNNIWQIGANMDYFANHVDSPFMHLWYIAILLQFDLVFPIIFFVIKKISCKKNVVSVIISAILTVGFTAYFVYGSYTKEIMPVYYGTLSRVFSLFAGVMAGYISQKDKLFKVESNGKIVFWLSMFVLCVLFVKCDGSDKNYGIIMAFATLLAVLMVLASTAVTDEKTGKISKAFNWLSDISYEVYLVQYPLIYYFQMFFYNEEKPNNTVLSVIICSLLIGWLLHYIFNYKNQKSLRKCLLVLLAFVAVCGSFEYLITEDHTEEMRMLEQQLAESDELLQQYNEEYQQKLLQEQQQWDEMLQQLQSESDGLADVVTNVTVTAIGDSVMLGASQALRNTFPNCYCDAKVSRTFYVGATIAADLKKKNMLGNVVVIHLGTNGNVPDSVKRSMIESCQGKDVFMLNCTNDKDVHVNASIEKYCQEYDYVHFIDWVSLSKGHNDWFYGDGIHLTSTGRRGYAQIVYDAVYQLYNERLMVQQQQIYDQHQQEQLKKISFYGNDLLKAIVSDLQRIYPEASFNNESDWQSLIDVITNQKQQESLNYNIVLVFDKTVDFNKEQYQQLIGLLSENNVVVVKTTDRDNVELQYGDNVKVIDLSEQIAKNADLLAPDKLHLSQKGNELLVEAVSSALVVVNQTN